MCSLEQGKIELIFLRLKMFYFHKSKNVNFNKYYYFSQQLSE